MRAGLGLRGHEVEVVEAEPVRRHVALELGVAELLAFRGARGRAGEQPYRARHPELDDLPAVDDRLFRPVAHLLVGGRRVLADGPARHRHRIVVLEGLEHGVLGDRSVADRRPVDEGQMREVQQVVDDQLVVAVDVEIGALVAPVVGALPRVRNDQALVGERRIAHPDPDPVVLLHRRKGAHLRAGRDRRLTRHVDALAGDVELEPVIVAGKDVALHAALSERHAAVAAAVLEGHRVAVLGTPEDDLLVADRASEWLTRDLVRLRGHIPAVFQEH